MALGSVAIAIIFPFLPVGLWFGFASPPLFFDFFVGATAACLTFVEIIKGLFYHRPRNATPLLTGQPNGAAYLR